MRGLGHVSGFFFLGKTKETISLVLSRWLEFWKALVLAADFKKEIHAILWHLDSVLGGWLVVYLWGRGVRGRYSALSLMTVGVLMFWKWEYSELCPMGSKLLGPATEGSCRGLVAWAICWHQQPARSSLKSLPYKFNGFPVARNLKE